MTWNEFKPQLFKKMDGRREWQLRFSTGQVYAFIIDCSKYFNQAKAAEAQEALTRTQDQGTFLLVADTLSQFQQIVSAAIEQQPAVVPDREPLTQPVARDTEPVPDARRGSGRPFRP